MKISIALCTYNGERFLREQLESIASQTLKPDEIIVCDDCSRDATVEIVRDFAANVAFAVRLFVNEQNLRSTKNFEKAIRLCTGEIIFLSDQDDVWDARKLEKFAAEFERDENVNLVFCDAELVDENLKPLGKTSWQAVKFESEHQKMFQTGNVERTLLNRNMISGCTMAFRAEYKNLILPIPADMKYVIHDYWITLMLLTVGKIQTIPETLVKYRQHSAQQLGLNENEINLSLQEKAVAIWDYQLLYEKFESLKKHLDARFAEKKNEYAIDSANLLTELESQSRHARARAEIQRENNGRIFSISKELFARRYHRHSNGFKSAAKDLSLYFSR